VAGGYLNGIIGEQEIMDATTLPLVKMPNVGLQG